MDVLISVFVKKDLTCLWFFLHFHEKKLNGRIEKSDFDGAEITLESRNGYGIRTKSAVYKFRPYCPKNEFEWGTIEFDFTTGKTKVDKPFLFDAYETEVEKYIKSIPVSNLPKEAIVPFM